MRFSQVPSRLTMVMIFSLLTPYAVASNPVVDLIQLANNKIFKPMKASRQAKESASIDGALILQAMKQGKAVIFFPRPIDQQVWMDDLGDSSFVVGDSTKQSRSDRSIDFIVVEPGTYYLQSTAKQEQHKTQHVNYPSRDTITTNSIGLVQLTNTQFREMYTKMVWHNAEYTYENQVVSETCQTINGVPVYGSCIPQYQQVQVLSKAAGYYPEPYWVSEDGITVETHFNEFQSPASITVDVGEVVFTDELFFENKNSIGWHEDQCMKVNLTQYQCLMRGFRFSLLTQQNRLADFKQKLIRNGWKLEAADLIKYRTLKLNALPAGSKTNSFINRS